MNALGEVRGLGRLGAVVCPVATHYQYNMAGGFCLPDGCTDMLSCPQLHGSFDPTSGAILPACPGCPPPLMADSLDALTPTFTDGSQPAPGLVAVNQGTIPGPGPIAKWMPPPLPEIPGLPIQAGYPVVGAQTPAYQTNPIAQGTGIAPPPGGAPSGALNPLAPASSVAGPVASGPSALQQFLAMLAGTPASQAPANPLAAGTSGSTATPSTDIGTWLQQNWMLAAGGALVLFMMMRSK